MKSCDQMHEHSLFSILKVFHKYWLFLLIAFFSCVLLANAWSRSNSEGKSFKNDLTLTVNEQIAQEIGNFYAIKYRVAKLRVEPESFSAAFDRLVGEANSQCRLRVDTAKRLKTTIDNFINSRGFEKVIVDALRQYEDSHIALPRFLNPIAYTVSSQSLSNCEIGNFYLSPLVFKISFRTIGAPIDLELKKELLERIEGGLDVFKRSQVETIRQEVISYVDDINGIWQKIPDDVISNSTEDQSKYYEQLLKKLGEARAELVRVGPDETELFSALGLSAVVVNSAKPGIITISVLLFFSILLSVILFDGYKKYSKNQGVVAKPKESADEVA
jgi:hypothetical protein